MARTLEQIDREWRELSAQAARLEQVSAQLDELARQRGERQARVEETAAAFRKEQDDVDKLERGGLRAFLLGLTGNKEEQLSLERREALAARCQYDQAVSDLEYLDEKCRRLLEEKEQLTGARRRLDALAREKAALLKDMGGAVGEQLMELDGRQAELEHQLREVEEALRAGRQAELCLGQVLDSLDSAESWGVWDMLGGGMVSTMIKHDHLDSAQAGLRQVQRALYDFRTELADVGQLQVPDVAVGSFATFADFFFDGLFADWYVQSGIHRTQEGVSEVHVQVLAVLRTLGEMKARLNAERAAVEEQRSALLGMSGLDKSGKGS